MRKFIFLFTTVLIIAACKEKKAGINNVSDEDSPGNVIAGNVADMTSLVDSIRRFKPMKLSITTDHSDVDELIPLGYNNHGTFAYLVSENSGGASGLHLGILPAYEDFNLQSRLDSDEENDTILVQNKALIYQALRSQDIRLQNSVSTISADSLQKMYGIMFEVQKTYGPGDPDYDPNKKLLSSVQVRYRQGETDYPSEISHKAFTMSNAVYDVYISDHLVITGEEGLFGFVVLVTEGRGFEGLTRKAIELVSLGVIKGRD
jgi:hypothetical protein